MSAPLRLPVFQPFPSASAPTPFERSDRPWFVHRTSGGFSRCDARRDTFSYDALGRAFEMGYTNLWVMCRTVLVPRHGEPVRRALASSDRPAPSVSRTEGRYYAFRADGLVCDRGPGGASGFATEDEALAALAADGQHETGLVALLVEDIPWH